MTTDQELLQAYVRERSQPAFTELVRRHADLVYGAARRQLWGYPSQADDVTQTVFALLAAKAVTLTATPHLAAWLYTTTRHTVSHVVRAERRRQSRETLAQALQSTGSASTDMPALPPGLIDTMLVGLDEGDRDLVLRRFFGGHSYAAIGAAANLSEDAARMRVSRALEAVREVFARHGITTTAAAVGAILAQEAVAAPAPLVAALAITTASGAPAAALAAAQVGAVSFMTTSNPILWTAAAAIALAAAFSTYEYRAAGRLRAEVDRLSESAAQLPDAERRASEQALRAAQAERRAAELQRRLDQLAATPPPVPAPAPPPAPDARALAAARMANLKPQLEAGRPIKGAIVLMVQDKPVSHPVEFRIGQETRVEVGDDGSYAITPSLNPDGSVAYAIRLTRKDAASGQERVLKMPTVIQTPWEGFTLSTGEGRVVAFDPDEPSP